MATTPSLRNAKLGNARPGIILTATRAALVVVLLTAGISVRGQIYKVTDGDGVEFTDRPQTEAKKGQTVEEITLPQLNTTPATAVNPDASEQRAQQKAEQESAVTAPETVTIISPENESTIAMGPGNFTVQVMVQPPLTRTESLLLLMDGEAVGPAQKSSTWQIEGALRGPHDLQVRRQAGTGDTVAQSESVRIYVLRPSVIGR